MITVSDIHALQSRKKLAQQGGIDAVLERSYRQIRKTITLNSALTSCVLEIPEFIIGKPIYDLGDCIVFVKRNLESNGFKVLYVFPRLLFVSWTPVAKESSVAQFDVKPSGKVVLSLI